MNLVDSSGWLEYFADTVNADNFAAAIENTSDLIVSTINIYEVFKKVFQQKDENAALQAIALMHQSLVIDVNSQIAVAAAEFNVNQKIPMEYIILSAIGIF